LKAGTNISPICTVSTFVLGLPLLQQLLGFINRERMYFLFVGTHPNVDTVKCFRVDRKNKRQLSNWATLAGGGFASDVSVLHRNSNTSVIFPCFSQLEIDTSSCIGKFLTVEAIGASLNFLFFVVGGALFAHGEPPFAFCSFLASG
jgi:hypothetical protein